MRVLARQALYAGYGVRKIVRVLIERAGAWMSRVRETGDGAGVGEKEIS